jgi:hypothetical protein
VIVDVRTLHTKAHDAASQHEHLARRVRKEAGSHGISRLRVKLAEAARQRIRAENDLAKAIEAQRND